MNKFKAVTQELQGLVSKWEVVLSSLNQEIYTEKRNSQNRNIKQIIGHMIDSASNNTHRIIHLQYQTSPINFPDYANLGNNDKWIAIQHYESEDWHDLIKLWKYVNLHICHVISNIDETKLENIWASALKEEISLNEMILGYLPHFNLHISEIEQLMKYY